MRDDHVALTRCYYCGEGSTILLAKSYRRVGNDMEADPLLEQMSRLIKNKQK